MAENIEPQAAPPVGSSAWLGGIVGACACCGGPAEQERSIHRDGFGVGPEVWLCNACGMGELPTLAEIWCRIKVRMEPLPPNAKLRDAGESDVEQH